MQISRYSNIAIEGLSVALPKKLVDVSSYASVFGKESIDKFSKMTGVQTISRSIEEQTASDLGFEAAKNLFKEKHISIDKIKIIVFVSQKPDVRVPSTAFLLHRRLGLGEDCMCFDINLACSGFIYGLNTVSSLLSMHSQDTKALLITADTSIKSLAPNDKTVSMLFGDSGSALLLGKSLSECKSSFASRSDGERFKSIITPAGGYRNKKLPTKRVLWSDDIYRSDYDTHMKGMEVFGFSISDVPRLMKDYMEELNMNINDIDCFALHQANAYMLKKIAKKLKIPLEKLPMVLNKYGNNSSNSIPLVIADTYGSVTTDEDLQFFGCGFGAGLSWAASNFKIQANNILPIIQTNNYLNHGE